MKIERKVVDVGDSLGLILSKDLCSYLEFEKGTPIIISDEKGKHGKFIAIWKKPEEQ